MNDLLTYFWKFSIVLALLIAFYHFVLRKETLHYFKRAYLLIAPWVAILLPLLKIEAKESSIIYDFAQPLDPLIVEDEFMFPIQNGFDETLLIYGILAIISLFLFVKTLFGIQKVFSIINDSEKKKLNVGVLCDTRKSVSPFSFFQYIVVKIKDHHQSDIDQIIEHEQVHVYQRHFIDMLQAQVLTIFCWWNPMIWLYRHFVVENLEFIVDKEVLRGGVNKKEYQFSILKTSVYDSSMVFANHFNQSLIKKRIEMMNKQLSNPKNLWRTVFVLPMLLLLWVGIGQLRAAIPSDQNPKTQKKYTVDGTFYSETEFEQEFGESIEGYLVVSDLDKNGDRTTRIYSTKNSYAESKDYNPQTELIADEGEIEIDSTKLYLDGETISKEELKTIFTTQDGEYISVMKDLEDNVLEHRIYSSPESYQNSLDYYFTTSGKPRNRTDLYDHKYDQNEKDTIPVEADIYLEGEKITMEEMKNLDPDVIKSIDVTNKDGKKEIRIKVKHEGVTIYKEKDHDSYQTDIDFISNGFDDVIIYINGKEVSNEKKELKNLTNIESINVIKNEGRKEIHVQLKGNNTYYFVDDVRLTEKVFSRKYKNHDFAYRRNWVYSTNDKTVNVNMYWTSKAAFENRKSKEYYESTYGIKVIPPPAPPPAPKAPATPNAPQPPTPPAPPSPPTQPETLQSKNNKPREGLNYKDFWDDNLTRFWYDGVEMSYSYAQKYREQDRNIIYYSTSQETGLPEKNVAIFSKNMYTYSQDEVSQMHPNGRPFSHPEQVIDIPDKMPEYPGGIESFRNEVESLYNIPSDAKDKKLEGTIIARFVVEKDGSIGTVRILKGIEECGECTFNAESAIQTVSKRFIPAKKNGEPVRFWFTLPIRHQY